MSYACRAKLVTPQARAALVELWALPAASIYDRCVSESDNPGCAWLWFTGSAVQRWDGPAGAAEWRDQFIATIPDMIDGCAQ